jgi:hypothetical protein
LTTSRALHVVQWMANSSKMVLEVGVREQPPETRPMQFPV